MKVPRHWAREFQQVTTRDGEDWRLGCWGWSESTLAEAAERARAATERVARYLATGERSRRDLYEYGSNPPREEIIQEFPDERGDVAAFISRNRYGALVLNARDLMFIDVDLPPRSISAAVGGLVSKLFGRAGTSPEQAVRERIAAWAESHRDYSLNVYQTAAGFRCAVTDRVVQPGGELACSLFDQFGSDALYRKLCDVQQCFRARLSPKPWRVGLARPHQRFPWENGEAEAAFCQWQREYDAASQGYAVCRLVERHGPGEIDLRLAAVLHLHDEMTGCGEQKPLA